MVRRREMQAALEEGIARREFSLDYQPIVELSSGAIKGFEALVRWPDPVRGSVPPIEFIALAEETGLIIPLGSWVLQQAITDLARWRGPDPDPQQPGVSVNVSARQFRDPGFVAGVRKNLDETGLVPERPDARAHRDRPDTTQRPDNLRPGRAEGHRRVAGAR